MLTEQTIRIVKATASTVAIHAEVITQRFYRLMFASHPETQYYFNQAHQFSGGQQKALAGAICAYAANIDQLEALGPAVELIAQKHCSLGIQPEHYSIVGTHLLAAIKDVLGDAASAEILTAWEEAYQFLAKVFIQREGEIYREQAAEPGGWNGYRPFVVDRKIVESDVVVSFYLKPEDGASLPIFRPGQYITIKIHHPEIPTSPRNYSLSDRPDVEYYRISVKRELGITANAPAGIVSSYLHDCVEVGDTISVAPPCGEFVLNPNTEIERPIVFLSGGIGITPVLSMFKSLSHLQLKNPVYFIHAARNSRVHAFAKEVESLSEANRNFYTHVLYDAPIADDVQAGRCDSTGIVDAALLQKLLPNNDAEFYFCGPRPFMASVYQGLKEWGVDESRIHFEFFGPRQDITKQSEEGILGYAPTNDPTMAVSL